ncbi:hypothetical protein M409DRAFT_53090 [Zasmidium cellare ATCC 36951]|uniref:CYTH domain-containing protein n=1 Tax=Zasmidium cellare ATCC 36951 TaxID=1080233 RepID=A0A6A6CMY9_ZASCE|nr:uncharacterized protein M409DRAFT_53090 [Zasmidium cellare ATCC 36951]KAF2168401.1 hypothetical protein M409DRAFT_53090 [Zasmidium cellare ATCC 36951]
MYAKSALQYAARAARVASFMSSSPPAHLFEHTKRFSTTAPTSPAVAHLEVERKFNCNPVLGLLLETSDAQAKGRITPFAAIAQNSPLKFARQPDEMIVDQYFDYEGKLSANNIWVRQRTVNPTSFQTGADDSGWEAKVRVGGDYQNSEFEEVCGKDDVMKLVGRFVPKIQATMNMGTSRKSWVASECSPQDGDRLPRQVLVVIDEAMETMWPIKMNPGEEAKNFKHSVGEVELTRSIELTGDDEADQDLKMRMTGQMSEELKAWMERHEELFPTDPAPQGKLTAFYAWKDMAEVQRAAWMRLVGPF